MRRITWPFLHYLTFALFSIIVGVFKAGFLIKTQWKNTISSSVLTATAVWLKVSLLPKVLVFLADLGGGPSLRQIYHHEEVYTLGSSTGPNWNLTSCFFFNIHLQMWQASSASSAVSVCAEWSPEINGRFFAADWCLLPLKRLSGSLELLRGVPDERDVTQRLFLNMMEPSSISISSLVYLMRQWDKEIPECRLGGL